MFGRGRIATKSPQQVGQMRQAGLVVADIHDRLRSEVRAGLTTADLDAMAREVIAAHGATSNFLGYHGFPAVICASVNDEVVHGIPGDRALVEGDLVSLDCGAIVDGWHGDAALTVRVGQVSPERAELDRVTEVALWAGIAAAQPGARLGDVSAAVQASVEAAGQYGIVADYTGHGIGREMHEEPDVPNLGRAGKGPGLEPGVVIAIEPMVTLGSPLTRTLADDWTVVTLDGSSAAHWEHTVAVTPEGPWVLTEPDGGRARLGVLDVRCGAR